MSKNNSSGSSSSDPKPLPEATLDSLNDQFQNALNKPDFKELDMRSPISPLRTHLRGRSGSHSAPLASSSSSSSSSGSFSGNAAAFVARKRSDGGGGSGSHSGELSGSSDGSPSGRSARNCKSGHRRSNSGGAPSIYSGSVNSPNVNLLPCGNICPSGKIGKTGMASRSSARSDVLGSGTGIYGHGSIMRGKLGGDGSGNVAAESVTVKRAMVSLNPDEVKRVGNEMYKRGNFGEALCLYDRAIAISPYNAACRSNRAAALIGLGRLVEAVKECEEAVRLDPAYGRAHQRLAALHLR